YLMDHPKALFGSPLEASVFDPNNPYALAPHLCAAANELPITDQDQDLFGPNLPVVLTQLGAEGLLRQRSTGWHWVLPESPTDLTDLRGSGGQTIQLVESATGRLLGTVDQGRAPATVHPGAVYLHQGETFLVEQLDLATGLAALKAANPVYTTMPIFRSSLRVIEQADQSQEQGATWHYGQVEVISQVTGFDRLSLTGREKLGSFPLEMPEQTLRTTGTWCVLQPAVTDQLPPDLLPGALHGAEHAGIGPLPLFAACDRWDLGGLSTKDHPQTGGPSIFIHDAQPGGAGLAKQAFERRHELIKAVAELLQTCACDAGCPSCIQSPKCGNANQVLSKPGALALLAALLTTAL
ncbi:MAG: DUF1998 domain-containing protein, partial [Micrococcales bacterium]|nr:DUF1998 domain-containing protein [Micrococcales bacterium]